MSYNEFYESISEIEDDKEQIILALEAGFLSNYINKHCHYF